MEADTLRVVFSFLKCRDLMTACFVCKKWRNVVKAMHTGPLVPCVCCPCPSLTSLGALLSKMRSHTFYHFTYQWNATRVPVTEEEMHGHVCCCSAEVMPTEWFVAQHAPEKLVCDKLKSRKRTFFSLPGKPHFEFRIVSVGLDAAGRTTSLYLLKLHEFVSTIPTVGFNVETIPWRIGKNKCELVIWEVGGQEKIRAIWKHYIPCDGVIFTVSSCELERIFEARDALHNFVQLVAAKRVAPVLIFASKQDLPICMTVPEIAVALDMHALTCSAWRVQGYSRTTVDGTLQQLSRGIDWLVRQLVMQAVDSKWGKVNINKGTSTIPFPHEPDEAE
ncbi:ADP-ribosylation factor 1 [Pelomyxa schiedti]|nr:ADP-ribosylation factor 1 [Pelomyxa schiedti]